MPGFAPARRATFVSAKVTKTILTVAWPSECPARFTNTGGGQTRLAQTLPTFSPVPVALLGHATRPGEPRGKGESTRNARTRPTNSFRCSTLGLPGRRRTTEDELFMLGVRFYIHIYSLAPSNIPQYSEFFLRGFAPIRRGPLRPGSATVVKVKG